ncbi:MAG: UDP-N-acetyl-D-mannosaminuronic acid transferase (WecB/TagA/CpsF family) [Hyphomicrobiaceae bacterium]|jgi:UDP-N-acetyl-D-mannosaminuronic acid transferase (WecB/TagA/CpsF family)
MDAYSPEQASYEVRVRHLPEDRVISLSGLEIMDPALDGAAHWIVRRTPNAVPTQLSFLNADCVNIMHRNPAYQDPLQQSGQLQGGASMLL